MSVACYIILTVGALLIVGTFVHRIYFTLHGKMTRKAYQCCRWGISFLAVGMLIFFGGIYGNPTGGKDMIISGAQAVALFYVSGVWMLIGLIMIISYYVMVHRYNE